jgi:RHH-type proline utilization regulon transcriptional repressor/proline dehydrogenase/delta 1-pyrroline-5-carboxylate dehydrogenase
LYEWRKSGSVNSQDRAISIVHDQGMAAPQVHESTASAEIDRIDHAVGFAEQLLRAAAEIPLPRSLRRRQRNLAAIIENPGVANTTLQLTDQVMRIGDDRAAAGRFADVAGASAGAGFGAIDRVLLRLGAAIAPRLPRVVMPLVRRRVRNETDGLVVPADDPRFARHIARRRDDGFGMNINLLGEAILSEHEANERIDGLLKRIARPDVTYVSVKISAIYPNVSSLAYEATVNGVAERLRRIYRAALSTSPHTFVNLDMEEYRDLALTIDAFTTVLGEPEFATLEAGIVLQAYLPDSHDAAQALGKWALARVAAGGAGIKVRLVKGANLAMERVEAELRGWPLATYGTKADVDASYKRLLDTLLEPRFDGALRVGVASHNLFDVSWALLLGEELEARNVRSRLELEMLEGMSPAQAHAVRRQAGSVLLYAPVVADSDFAAAIAYLARRLDENTSPENFLSQVFEIEPGNEAFRREAEKFRIAVVERHAVRTESMRSQNRSAPEPLDDVDTPFRNEPDTDFTQPANRAWLARALIGVDTSVDAIAVDTSDVDVIAVDASDVDVIAVDSALRVARAAQPHWWATDAAGRARALNAVGDVIAARRGEILATMVAETGKTIAEGDPEVSEAVDFARYYARESLRLDAVAARGAAVPTPLGTVVVAPPWNFPFAIAAGGVLAALSAGNAVVLKPAPQAMRCAALVVECCHHAGLPPDLVQLVAAPDNEVGRYLISHEAVDAVILTGAFETAALFHSWRPDLRLHAETSGKNAMVITAAADIDVALRDLIKSAFGHAGQKCSAASLAIVEASLYDDESFIARLQHAVLTLRVGPAHDLSTDVGPLIGPPSEALERALTRLDAGEHWLVQPRQLAAHTWSPGVRMGVRPGTWFHMTECFGPVLGVMRAADLRQAIEWQNAVAYGLTAGLHSLDPHEIERWCEAVHAGNLYVNRGTTGAIVQRQPFGGWKRSSVGPVFKAGGPHYVQSLQRWTDTEVQLDAVDTAFQQWMHDCGTRNHDPSGLRAESNVYRYRPLPHGVVVRLGSATTERDEQLLRAAARVTGCSVVWSRDVDEDDESFAARLATLDVSRLRVVGQTANVVRSAAHRRGISIDEAPPVGEPSVELPRWMHEQALSVTMHRHGHVQPSATVHRHA